MKIGISNLDHIAPILKIIQAAEQHFEGHLSVLDVGCGKGVYGYMLRAMFGDRKLFIEGVDPKIPQRFQLAMRHVYDGLFLVDIRDFLRKNGTSYTIVLANHVMEHLPRPIALECIKEFKKIAQLVLIGLPKANKDHIYFHADSVDFHTHKWGYHDLNFRELGLKYAQSIEKNQLFWWANERECSFYIP